MCTYFIDFLYETFLVYTKPILNIETTKNSQICLFYPKYNFNNMFHLDFPCKTKIRFVCMVIWHQLSPECLSTNYFLIQHILVIYYNSEIIQDIFSVQTFGLIEKLHFDWLIIWAASFHQWFLLHFWVRFCTFKKIITLMKVISL